MPAASDSPMIDKIPRKVAILGDFNTKIIITISYGFFLLISHQFSFYPSDMIPERLNETLVFSLAIILFLFLVGWDYIVYQELTKKLELSPTINLYMKGKRDPEILVSDDEMTLTEFVYHFLIVATRVTFVIGAIQLNSEVEFLEGIGWLVRIFTFISITALVTPVVFFTAFLPTRLSNLRRYYSSKYRKVPSLEIRDFHHHLVNEWGYAKENYRTPLENLITGKELPEVEFKASYWTEMGDTGKKNLLLQDAVIKVVAGLMNSKTGGHLIIGIQDNTRNPTGLVDADISQLKNDPSWDQLERHIVTTLSNNLSSASSILANKTYIMKEERWPQNKEGERIIHIHIPEQARYPVYALQKEAQKLKLRKWREGQRKKPDSERHPGGYVPDDMREDFKFRFLREQTSTFHQSQEDWDKHWHDRY